jgi:hypothetical protein
MQGDNDMMSGGKLRRQASSGGTRSSSSKKTQRTSRSDTPSGSACNSRGRDVLNYRLRSVLSHPLGLPLFYMLNNEKSRPLSKDLVAFINQIFPGADANTEDFAFVVEQDNKLDGILETAVTT